MDSRYFGIGSFVLLLYIVPLVDARSTGYDTLGLTGWNVMN